MMNLNERLEMLFGSDKFRTDICKVRVFDKGYLFQGNIVMLNERTLTVEVPTYYRDTVHIIDVDVDDIIKIKKETK